MSQLDWVTPINAKETIEAIYDGEDAEKLIPTGTRVYMLRSEVDWLNENLHRMLYLKQYAGPEHYPELRELYAVYIHISTEIGFRGLAAEGWGREI